MQINLKKKQNNSSNEERGRSLKKCIQGLNLLSPKSKLDLDFRTINTGRDEGYSPDPMRTGHFCMERCPSERKVWSSRKKQGK
jgi:hypothetical protein